jgi:hypothetical protein
VVVDGVVAGHGRSARKGRRLELQVELFTPLSARQREQLEAAAARIAEIVEAEPSVAIGAVEARPHL